MPARLAAAALDLAARTVRRAIVASVVVSGTVVAQNVDAVERSTFDAAPCRDGPACRLTLVLPRSRPNDPLLVRGPFPGGTTLGPAWSHVPRAVVSDPEATAHVARAVAARSHARRTRASFYLAGLTVAGLGVAAIARRDRGDGFDPADGLLLPLALLPGFVIAAVGAHKATPHEVQAHRALARAVDTWNAHVEPRAP